jgi:hypothetical protein
MKVFKLSATIDDEVFEVNSLFGMEAFVSTAELRGETLGDMFTNIGKAMDSSNISTQGVEILKIAKQLTYQGYLSYCSVKDIEPLFSEKKISIIFDSAGDLQDTIYNWGVCFMATLPNAKVDSSTKKKE